MALVWIPSLLRNLTDGQAQVNVPGTTVRQVIDSLDTVHPGIKTRLCEGDRLKPALMITVDGKTAAHGLSTKVDETSEIHFLLAISGG